MFALLTAKLEDAATIAADCQGRVARAALEIAEVGTVQPDLERERLLREAALGSQVAQVAGEALPNIHAGTLTVMPLNGRHNQWQRRAG